jgi:hypothetical protein
VQIVADALLLAVGDIDDFPFEPVQFGGVDRRLRMRALFMKQNGSTPTLSVRGPAFTSSHNAEIGKSRCALRRIVPKVRSPGANRLVIVMQRRFSV